MFEFTPRTEEEVQKMSRPPLLAEGEADFEVIRVISEDKGARLMSKSGNPMLQLTLKVWDKDGNEGKVDDWLVFMDVMMFKIKHFWDSVGKPEVFASGKFDPGDCFGKCGKLKLTIQKGNEKPRDKWKGSEPEFYPDRNSVKDYIEFSKDKANRKTKENDAPFFDDDIPFG
jgi:hypothetical protein